MNIIFQRKLKDSLKFYNRDETHKVGKVGDVLLKELVARIRNKPSLDNFILFTNCLNYFYSTRLHILQGDKNSNIIQVARLLKRNWLRGIKLYEEKEGAPLKDFKIDELRNAIYEAMGRNAYSFTTIVFHQLNSEYPILDTTVNAFSKKENYGRGIDFYKNDYKKFHKRFDIMRHDLGWKKGSNKTLDRSIWSFVLRNPEKYFPTRSIEEKK